VRPSIDCSHELSDKHEKHPRLECFGKLKCQKILAFPASGLKNNLNDHAVVKSINEKSHCMGKKTIAEFVEDEETLEILREIGIDYAQGWGGKKMPITELLN